MSGKVRLGRGFFANQGLGTGAYADSVPEGESSSKVQDPPTAVAALKPTLPIASAVTLETAGKFAAEAIGEIFAKVDKIPRGTLSHSFLETMLQQLWTSGTRATMARGPEFVIQIFEHGIDKGLLVKVSPTQARRLQSSALSCNKRPAFGLQTAAATA